MPLYYVKTPEQFISIISASELKRGTQIDAIPDAVGINEEVWASKAIAAQGELEILLADRWEIERLRNLDIPYLDLAHASLIWWYLEINGKGRELLRQRYEDTIARLKAITALVDNDGNIIRGATLVVGTTGNRIVTGRVRVGQRRND